MRELLLNVTANEPNPKLKWVVNSGGFTHIRSSHPGSQFVHNGSLYVIGPQQSSSPYGPGGDGRKLDLNTNNQSLVRNLNVIFSAAFTDGENIFSFGGSNSNGTSGQSWMYRAAFIGNWTLLTTPREILPRRYPHAAFHNGKAYLGGGDHDGVYRKDLWEYDTKNNTYTDLSFLISSVIESRSRIQKIFSLSNGLLGILIDRDLFSLDTVEREIEFVMSLGSVASLPGNLFEKDGVFYSVSWSYNSETSTGISTKLNKLKNGVLSEYDIDLTGISPAPQPNTIHFHEGRIISYLSSFYAKGASPVTSYTGQVCSVDIQDIM